MQYSATHNAYNSWTIPLNAAIGLHLVVAFSFIFLPGLLKSKAKYEDIYTVNLISISEPVVQEVAVQPVPASKPVPPPVESPKAIPLAEVKAPSAPAQPEQPVSIKPVKRKIKKEEPPDNKLKQKELEQSKRQTIAEALKAEQDAAELARRAAEEAARQQKLLEQQLAEIKTQSSPARKSSGRSGSSTLTGLEMQYYSTIAGRIAQFWSLPQYKNWDPGTEAVVVITISQNGSILKQFFEKASNDPTFDQFVRKTLHDASPLPPIPPALQRTSWEVGLRFRPEGIQ